LLLMLLLMNEESVNNNSDDAECSCCVDKTPPAPGCLTRQKGFLWSRQEGV